MSTRITTLCRWWGALLALALLSACNTSGFVSTPTTPPVVIVDATAPAANTPAPAAATAAPAQPTTPPEATAVAAAPTAEAQPTAAPAATSLLDTVKQRGKLICGVNADLQGFGFFSDVRRTWSGFDVDFCRVVAAAVLGDANAVEFKGLTSAERWPAIRNGDIDVLFRNSTWTAERDAPGGEGVDWGPTIFHDGQTVMTRKSANITTLEGLAGKTVCVEKATTSESNLRDEFAARQIDITILAADSLEANYGNYEEGRCEAVTSDSSQLVSVRQTLRVPDDHEILGDRFSREPLGPAFIENDSRWRDAVSWAVFATMYAEELRVDQRNVTSLAETSTDPRVRRLLGREGTIGEHLGLSPDFGLKIIQQVGNYADIYNRNLGPNTPFALDRGPNKAWNLGAGGVLASPPFR